MEKEGTGKKILVVDDKEQSRNLVRKVLTFYGYEVIGAGSGEDGINRAQTELPDLILMDIRLPGKIDGLEATRRIRAIPELTYILIVAMSASVWPGDKQRTVDAGCVDFIHKPIDIDELPGKVAKYIARCSGD